MQSTVKIKKCMWLTRILALIVACAMVFGLAACGGGTDTRTAEEVTDVVVTAEEGETQGAVGSRHILSYKAPEGSDVSVSVSKDSKSATADDYSYNSSTGVIVFYTTGTYTVTVYAAKDGLLGSGKTDITVTAQAQGKAEVSGVSVSAASGAKSGVIGAPHVVNYAVPDGSGVSVSVQKDGAAAEASDYSFDAATRKIVFYKEGNYTVTVTATSGESTASGSAVITVSAFEAPEITFTAAKTSAVEDEAVKLTHSVTYAASDLMKTEGYSVEYKSNAADAYAAAADSLYSLSGDVFAPHTAGYFRIAYTATGIHGSSAVKYVEIRALAAPVSVKAENANALNRIGVNVPTAMRYIATGAVDKYDISFDTHGDSRIAATKGSGSSFIVTAAAADTYTVTVKLTHKLDSSVHSSVNYKFYAVSDVERSPVFGQDPFAGMPSSVLTSVGMLPYFDATPAPSSITEKLTVSDVTLEVTDQNVKTSDNKVCNVDVNYVAGDEAYPYFIVSNFDNNTARGTFKLKMTVKDPATGAYAVATRSFTVTPMNSDPENTLKNYVNNNAFFEMNGLDYSIACPDARQNMVLTKTGVIIHRRNATWSLNGGNGDFVKIELPSPLSNYRVDFKMHIYGKNLGLLEGNVWLGIGMRTNDFNGWSGFIDIMSKDGKITGLFDNTDKRTSEAGPADGVVVPDTAGTEAYFRLERVEVSNTAVYTIYVKTSEDGAYGQLYRFTVDKATSHIGAPLAGISFTHRSGGGCYSLEDISVTAI